MLALEDGVGELLGADPDAAPARRRYVAEVRDCLEAEPPARYPPTPPRHPSAELSVALVVARAGA